MPSWYRGQPFVLYAAAWRDDLPFSARRWCGAVFTQRTQDLPCDRKEK
jgi:hypothetical protein